MRAMVLRRPAPADEAGPLEAADLPDPEPGPGEILIGVSACAVCRTDLQLAEGDLAARRLPVVPGHQAVGRVLALGPDAGGWDVGDRAGVGWLAGVDGTCRHCRAGRENLCEEGRFTGWDRDGGYAERMVARADVALPLPEGLADEDAAPLLCGGVIGYRSLRVAGVTAGARLGLFGFGASARLVIQVARRWGCEVHVCTRSEAEQRRALELGAAWAGGYDQAPPAPLDAAITFAPVGSVVVAALRAVDRGGTVAINAIHLDRLPEMPYELLWYERRLCSVANVTRQDGRELLALGADSPLETEVEAHPLEEANLALSRLREGRVSGAALLRI